MKRRTMTSIAIVFTLLLLALGGCASSPPERFYTLGAGLSGTSGASAAAAATASYSVAVGPVTIPAVVDRPQIVLTTGPNRVTLAEQSRWAEPLKESIPRLMADDLGQLLQDARITAYPQTSISDPDFRVLVDVQRFDSEQGEAATIDVLWSIRGKKNGTQRAGRTFRREPANGADYEALVAAHGRALNAVSREIATAIQEITSQEITSRR